MNIKKLAASLMMLSLCTVGVGNINALKNDPPLETIDSGRPRPHKDDGYVDEKNNIQIPVVQGHRDQPVFAPESTAEQLFDALCAAGLDPLSPRAGRHVLNTMGLRKYITELLRHGLTVETVQGLKGSYAVGTTLDTYNARIDGRIAAAKSEKAKKVREGVSAATEYVENINGIAAFARDMGMAATIGDFRNAITRLSELHLNDLDDIIYSLNGGSSADSLQAHKDALENMKTLMMTIISLGIQKITAGKTEGEQTKMRMLHMALVNLAQWDFDVDDMLRFHFEQFDPASAANGNRSLLVRYNEWVVANNTLKPNFGEHYPDFERRCVEQGKTPYPGLDHDAH